MDNLTFVASERCVCRLDLIQRENETFLAFLDDDQ